MKNQRLEIRLTEREYNIILSTSKKYNLTITRFILSVLIPFCLKTNSNTTNSNTTTDN